MADTVLIIGTGTMGAGIAQVAVTHGWTARLTDVEPTAVEAAIAGVRSRLDRLVEKGKMTDAERDEAAGRLLPASGAADAFDASLVIEAVVEDLDVKTRVFRDAMSHVDADAILATNTSSLSVSKIGAAVGAAHRVVGMHFFNPAPLLRLVEVVAGDETDPAVVDRVASIARSWGKEVARARDVPGFIVNHVARPYYLEAFRILEDGHAAADEIDRAMRRLGGFRMGPLELTDLIGQDVNTATTRSVWEQLDRPALLAPSRLQEQLVADGHLGRKTGRGVYDHGVDPPAPAIDVTQREPELTAAARAAIDRFCAGATERQGDESEKYIFARILVALIAQAAEARARGVAEPTDIDIALRYGTNYPEGPFAWARRIGADACRDLIEHLNREVAGGRFPVFETPAAEV